MNVLRRALGPVVLATLLASPAAAVEIDDLSDLFVFGDSIVDVGNTQDFSGGPGSPLDPTPASEGYFDGRFTNGNTPADTLNLAIEGTLSTNSLAGGDNFSYGGARGRDNSVVDPPLTPDPIPDLAAQVSAFDTAVGGNADPDALYMINVGGNDIFDALTLAGAGEDPSALIGQAAFEISMAVGTLQSLGAQHILFVGVGDVGGPPAANGAEAIGRALSEALNAAIVASLPTDVLFFDTIALFDAVLLDPEAFGLPADIITETSCLGDLGPSDPGSLCDQYAFFDDVHPTAPVLDILGQELISFVPEPGTGVLVGLGCLGLALRRRRA